MESYHPTRIALMERFRTFTSTPALKRDEGAHPRSCHRIPSAPALFWKKNTRARAHTDTPPHTHTHTHTHTHDDLHFFLSAFPLSSVVLSPFAWCRREFAVPATKVIPPPSPPLSLLSSLCMRQFRTSSLTHSLSASPALLASSSSPFFLPLTSSNCSRLRDDSAAAEGAIHVGYSSKLLTPRLCDPVLAVIVASWTSILPPCYSTQGLLVCPRQEDRNLLTQYKSSMFHQAGLSANVGLASHMQAAYTNLPRIEESVVSADSNTNMRGSRIQPERNITSNQFQFRCRLSNVKGTLIWEGGGRKCSRRVLRGSQQRGARGDWAESLRSWWSEAGSCGDAEELHAKGKLYPRDQIVLWRSSFRIRV